MVTESDIYIAILNQRRTTPDYASQEGKRGLSEELATPEHSHDEIKVEMRSMREHGQVEYESVAGREDHLEFKFFLTKWGERAMAPLADLGQAQKQVLLDNSYLQ